MRTAALGDFTPRQSLSAFEVGVKQRAADWLNYSVALYHMDWKNQTFFELSPAPFFTAANLSGDSKIKGIDVEVDITPNDWFRLTGGVSYNDVEFDDFAGAGSVATAVLTDPGVLSLGQQISAVGNRPRYTPNWTGSISTTFQLGELAGMENDLWLRVDSIYQGNFFVDNFERGVSLNTYNSATINAFMDNNTFFGNDRGSEDFTLPRLGTGVFEGPRTALNTAGQFAIEAINKRHDEHLDQDTRRFTGIFSRLDEVAKSTARIEGYMQAQRDAR